MVAFFDGGRVAKLKGQNATTKKVTGVFVTVANQPIQPDIFPEVKSAISASFWPIAGD